MWVQCLNWIQILDYLLIISVNIGHWRDLRELWKQIILNIFQIFLCLDFAFFWNIFYWGFLWTSTYTFFLTFWRSMHSLCLATKLSWTVGLIITFSVLTLRDFQMTKLVFFLSLSHLSLHHSTFFFPTHIDFLKSRSSSSC